MAKKKQAEEQDRIKEEEVAVEENSGEQDIQVESEDNEQEDSESSEPTPEEQLAEAKDKYLRIYSEFENFRRRTAKERLDLISTASRDVVEALLPVLDDFERAMKANENSESDGISLIYNKFRKALTDKGLKPMETKAGDEFDDEYHEAVTQIPAPDKSMEGKIVDVIEPGYFMGEKVIRFAKVVTGSKS